MGLWANDRLYSFADLTENLSTSWAGQAASFFPEDEELGTLVDSTFDGGYSLADTGKTNITRPGVSDTPPSCTTNAPVRDVQQAGQSNVAYQTCDSHDLEASSPSWDSILEQAGPNAFLLDQFRRIAQPPAAILIGGSKKWRRLQQYLCRCSGESRAVENALLCVAELLSTDATSNQEGHHRTDSLRRVEDRHRAACHEIRTKLAKSMEFKAKSLEHLLVAIFLLAWLEVIRDQDAGVSRFPRDLADSIITGHVNWSRSSQELLSWLNTLDSKATHLGGHHLLSSEALEIVSHYPTQITSSGSCGDEVAIDSQDRAAKEFGRSPAYSSSASGASPEERRRPLLNTSTPFKSIGHVKQALLHTILQPALQWHLTSQSYCRRISTHDKHHRNRFTSDDEYEVINACKQLELELHDLWSFRPAVVSLPAAQLKQVVSEDLAIRLEEIFSVYKASFWILFVYLHRVSWWNLPHSDLTRQALSEVWKNMRGAYGEKVPGAMHKIVHPSLLWPLFMFGCECADITQRSWAIAQIEALGEAKPIVNDDESDTDTLPPFRLSLGATRNAKRAAVLLTHLTQEQDKQRTRIDDRDLSITLFGCYFSII
ncbi:uncharacterized protein AB675_10823 [Cyphellophora attinorum]|uniref:Transcription factor domain-containing protein n=1 Tax=Cyphellophora attinorum TaxID=1664694 RepID=A0A0N0NMX2_9EURO|nr:uncharacterized protein AB675_10823 [Phialophora attinorum]KPI40709.1 hypothetical protein AB675_10823 [Phialophora attinorum]